MKKKLQLLHFNKDDTKHFIIQILGIKIKIKKYIPRTTLKDIHKSYKKTCKRIQNKLQNNEKIKVLFLIRETSKWTYNSLYREMELNPLFDPLIIVSLMTSVASGFDNTKESLDEELLFFKKLGYNVEKGYDESKKKFIDLKTFKPDIIFYDQHWDLPQIHSIEEVSNFSLTCLCNYGITLYHSGDNYSPSFHKKLFKYFVENKYILNSYENLKAGNCKNCIISGYPKLDTYLENNPNINLGKHWKAPEKFKIIYAPHHSFDTKGKIATFLENGQFILDFAKKHPETTWIFKPHPRLKFAIIHNNIMTKEETDNYYNEWSKIGNIYETGNYIDIFKTSDLMITDSCSFRIEYLPANKPIICPQTNNHAEFSEFGEKVNSVMYQTFSNEELNKTLEYFINGQEDYKKQEREELVPHIVDYSKRSSTKILEFIMQNLSLGVSHDESY